MNFKSILDKTTTVVYPRIMVKFTISHLVTELEQRKGEKFTGDRVSRESGLSRPTVLRLMNPSKTVHKIEAATIDGLLKFFRKNRMKVSVCDMILEQDEPQT